MEPITLLLLLWGASRSLGKGAAVSPPAVSPSPGPAAAASPPPLPTVAPAPITLPPKAVAPIRVGPKVAVPPSLTDTSFPGPRWELDAPPSKPVQARAAELLAQLWAKGEGAALVEDMGPRMGLTSARPTGFRAERHGSKKAVSAWRMKSGTVMSDESLAARTRSAASAAAKRAVRAVAPAPAPGAAPGAAAAAALLQPVEQSPAAPAALEPKALLVPTSEPVHAPEHAASAVQLPTLRRGAQGPDVQLLQTKLGGLEVDGKFGPLTEMRVRDFQRSEGLEPDGIVGKKTWGALFA